MKRRSILLSVIGFLLIALSQGWAQEPCVDSVFAEVVQDTVLVYHTGAFYNCCAVIKDSLSQQDSIINIRRPSLMAPVIVCVASIYPSQLLTYSLVVT